MPVTAAHSVYNGVIGLVVGPIETSDGPCTSRGVARGVVYCHCTYLYFNNLICPGSRGYGRVESVALLKETL